VKGPEANFYQRLVRTFPNWDMQRIETLTSNGVPDVHVCIPPGHEFWVELKVTGTVAGRTSLRMEQYAWGMRRAKRGGSVWVLSLGLLHVRGWRYPFKAEPGAKGHVTIVSPPDFELQDSKLNHIEAQFQ
jgi:hypothetical protein